MMGGSSLDEQIDIALDRLNKVKKSFDEGVIPKEDYLYQLGKYNNLIKQRKILDDADIKKPPSFFVLKLIITLFFGIVWFLGTFHVLIGSKVNILRVSKRATFGYSEMIINTDKIISMNEREAKKRYPLSYSIYIKGGFFK